MGGMMRRLCAVVVVFSAWQACRAQALVNLLEPQLGSGAPTKNFFWKMLDRNTSTYSTVIYKCKVRVQGPYSIQPTAYRITMATHVPPTKYPSSWTLEGMKPNAFHSRLITLDEVNGAVFSEGVYEGVLNQQMDLGSVRMSFDRRRVKIAEFELLGPLETLDAYWPYGKYPCSQRHAVVTPRRGPKTIFEFSSKVISPVDLRNVFKADDAAKLIKVGDRHYKRVGEVEFTFPPVTAPVIIGALFPEQPLVREVSILATTFKDRVKRVVLHGSFCDGGHCNKLGSKGWVRLGAVRPSDPVAQARIFIENPGKYKAYRLKFIRSDKYWTFSLRSISFLGCTV